jgi:TRAP-type mannitol/chloroaromatic compound transport system permease small subunit
VDRWLRIADHIDGLNERVGTATAWLAAVMVAVGAFNAIARYLGKHLGQTLSSNGLIELQWYLFSALFLLGAAYTLRHNAHVRVDIIYTRLSRRGRAWVNVLGTGLFLIPFSMVTLALSWRWVRNSFAVLESSPDPGGLPRYPLKALILVGFVLLLLQGIALLIREVAVLRGHATPEESHRGKGL